MDSMAAGASWCRHSLAFGVCAFMPSEKSVGARRLFFSITLQGANTLKIFFYTNYAHKSLDKKCVEMCFQRAQLNTAQLSLHVMVDISE